MTERPTRFIAYYGFKGGLGRTLAATSTALQFAQQGKLVLLIDCDLEAPGITLSSPFSDQLKDQPGLLEFLAEPETCALPVWHQVPKDVCNIRSQGQLWVLGAGKVTAKGYTDALDRLAKGALQADSPPVDRWRELVRALCRRSDSQEVTGRPVDFDLVILDLRTGLSLLSDVMFSTCAIGVLVFGLNQQNQAGAELILHGIDARERELGPHPALPWQKLERQQRRLALVGPIPDIKPEDLKTPLEQLGSVLTEYHVAYQLDDGSMKPGHHLRYDPWMAFGEVTQYIVAQQREQADRNLYRDLQAHVGQVRELLGCSVRDLQRDLQTLILDSYRPTVEELSRLKALVTELFLAAGPGSEHDISGRILDLNSATRSLDLAQAFWDALKQLEELRNPIGERLWYELNAVRLYKLRWNGTAGPQEPQCLGIEPWKYAKAVREEHERLWNAQQTWSPSSAERHRMLVDRAGILLIEQRWRWNAELAVERERVETAWKILVEELPKQAMGSDTGRVDPNTFSSGTVGWYLRALSHACRLNAKAELGLDDGRVREIAADLLQDQRLNMSAALQYWVTYARIGLALTLRDTGQRTKVIQKLIDLIPSTQYMKTEPPMGHYDIGTLYANLNGEDSLVPALRHLLRAIQGSEVLRYAMRHDEDLPDALKRSLLDTDEPGQLTSG